MAEKVYRPEPVEPNAEAIRDACGIIMHELRRADPRVAESAQVSITPRGARVRYTVCEYIPFDDRQ